MPTATTVAQIIHGNNYTNILRQPRFASLLVHTRTHRSKLVLLNATAVTTPCDETTTAAQHLKVITRDGKWKAAAAVVENNKKADRNRNSVSCKNGRFF